MLKSSNVILLKSSFYILLELAWRTKSSNSTAGCLNEDKILCLHVVAFSLAVLEVLIMQAANDRGA